MGVEQDLKGTGGTWGLGMVNVEINTSCNLRCPGCLRTIADSQGKWRNQLLGAEDFRRIVDGLPPARTFLAFGIGEPTLHPELPSLLQFAWKAKKFENISLTTNLLARELDYYVHLFASGLSTLTVSVDTLDPNLVEALRPGTEVKALRERIGSLHARFPGRVSACTVVSRRNIRALPQLLKELSFLGDLSVNLQPYDDLGNASGWLSWEERTWFNHQIPKLAAPFPNLKVAGWHFTPSFEICSKPWKEPYITVEGYVTPCCRMTDPAVLNFGNALSAPFQQIWNSTEVQEWRRNFLVESAPFCMACPMYVSRKAPWICPAPPAPAFLRPPGKKMPAPGGE